MANHLLQPDALVLDHAVVAAPIVAVTDGRIVSVGFAGAAPPSGLPESPIERIAGTLLPGFVDLQVNGAGGRAVAEASTDALDHVARTIAVHGAAAFLPTLITAPFAKLLEQIRAVAAWIESRPTAGATPLGIHVEGPFLSNPGAHPPDAMLDPTPARIDRLLDAGRGTIRLVTLSPSRPDAAAATARFCAAGVTVSLGHGSGGDGVAECVAAGARMATHLFNAMGPSSHRDPGLPGAVMDTAALSCSLIVDGIHVHEMQVRQAVRTIGVARTVLVTDCVSAMGMPDGRYSLGTTAVTLRDGTVRSDDGTLAGSAVTMFGAAENFLRAVPDAGPWTLAHVAAANPARLIGAADFGQVSPGRRAALCVLGPDRTLRVLGVGVTGG